MPDYPIYYKNKNLHTYGSFGLPGFAFQNTMRLSITYSTTHTHT